MTKYNKGLLDAAGSHLGLTEWAGAKHNPVIMEMFDTVGHAWVDDDETPWCAAFVGAVLAQLGLPTTRKLNARSYSTYGAAVSPQRAVPGDIVVLWRGSPESWMGHVAFFVRYEGSRVVLRGGNQGDAVTDAAYPVDRILDVRRADASEPAGALPTLREGDRGSWVRNWQAELHNLGYFPGEQDGNFGPHTLAATVAFQSENDLTTDGVVGPKTWAAMKDPVYRRTRPVSMGDLDGKSRTVDAANNGQSVVTIGTSLAGGAVLVGQANEAAAILQQAETAIDMVRGVGPTILIVGVIFAVGVGAWYLFGQIKKARLDDARTGANMSI